MRSFLLMILLMTSFSGAYAAWDEEDISAGPYCKCLMISGISVESGKIKAGPVDSLSDDAVWDIKVLMNNFMIYSMEKENSPSEPKSSFLRNIEANLADAVEILWPLYYFFKGGTVRARLTSHPIFQKYQSPVEPQTLYENALIGMKKMMEHINSFFSE